MMAVLPNCYDGTRAKYDNLKSLAIYAVNSSPNSPAILDRFKTYLKMDIDSTRRFDSITSIDELFDLLEIRNILSPTKIDPIKQIGFELSREESSAVNQAILNYETSLKTDENFIRCLSKQDHTINGKLLSDNILFRKRVRIHDELRRQIGTNYYRNFARYLNLQEGDIEAIDRQTNAYDYPAKVDKILQAFESRCDRGKWLSTLCNALEQVRRKDLSNIIYDIWSTR